MFTGIVEERGRIVDVRLDGAQAGPDAGSARLTVLGPKVTSDVGHGDSIAVSGVCLTVVDRDGDRFTVDVMAETLRRTTVGALSAGDEVNLERSVTPTTRLGGHIVQGHVDGTGIVVQRTRHPAYDEIRIRTSTELARYLAAKGSVAVDGISLTVIDVIDLIAGDGGPGGVEFTIGIIPETRTATTLGDAQVGAVVNLEVDVMAKYAERLLTAGAARPEHIHERGETA
ncbi:riboflavin synthase [Nakamurella sp.]|uniref:riboflavin synthase n=1 Tax=Nakamurella sp. TaxID=1869182 RepID=UPI003783C7EC